MWSFTLGCLWRCISSLLWELFNYSLIITNHNEMGWYQRKSANTSLWAGFLKGGDITLSIRTAFHEDVIVMTSHPLCKDHLLWGHLYDDITPPLCEDCLPWGHHCDDITPPLCEDRLPDDITPPLWGPLSMRMKRVSSWVSGENSRIRDIPPLSQSVCFLLLQWDKKVKG